MKRTTFAPNQNTCFMKTYKLLLAATAASLMLIGHNASAQVEISTGYQFSDFYSSGTSVNGMHGWRANALYNLPLFSIISLQPGIGYAFGATGKDDTGVEQREHYINVPLQVKGSIDIVPETAMYATFGPSLAWQFAGNTAFKKLDATLGVGLGWDFNYKAGLKFGYDWGLVNRSKDSAASIRRNVFYAAVTFCF